MVSESRAPILQFRLATLLWLTTVAAALALVVRAVERSPTLQDQLLDPFAWIGGFFTLVAFTIALCGCSRDGRRKRWFRRAWVAMAVLWILQVLSALACWHTFGEVEAVRYWFLTGLVLIPACLCGARSYAIAVGASIVIALCMLPFWRTQLLSMTRLCRVWAEVSSIADYLEDARQEVGSYPPDLSGYASERPDLQSLITYFPPEEPRTHYVLAYDLYEGDSPNREYSPRSGWYYYPD